MNTELTEFLRTKSISKLKEKLSTRGDHIKINFMLKFFQLAKSLVKIGTYIRGPQDEFESDAPVNSGTSAHVACSVYKSHKSDGPKI